jgi:hypothetical protein
MFRAVSVYASADWVFLIVYPLGPYVEVGVAGDELFEVSVEAP